MTTKMLRISVSVVYTPEIELDGLKPVESKLRPKKQAIAIAGRLVRNAIKERVPDGCVCSLIFSPEPEAN